MCPLSDRLMSGDFSRAYIEIPEKRLQITGSHHVFRIGRDPACDIHLHHPTISAHHADLEFTQVPGNPPMLFLRDRRSANGTYVNGVRITTTAISEKYKIQISVFRLIFIMEKTSILVRMMEAADQYTIEAENVGFAVKDHKILSDVDLVINQGEFVGLMGPSGSGKSTLLKALSVYIRANSGQVMLGGLDLYSHFDLLKSYIGYVPQDDIIFPTLTVRQSLQYSARLRLPADTTPEQREELVEETLYQLDLVSLKDRPIQALSGGQRKRVSIGVELLTRPKILIMDEPDAGLDPHIQDQLMNELRKLTNSGSTVIMTTHTIENFKRFDELLLVSMGHVVFYGPPNDALKFFDAGKNQITSPRHIFKELDSQKEGDPGYRRKLAREFSDRYKQSDVFKAKVLDRKVPDRTVSIETKTPAWKSTLLAPWDMIKKFSFRQFFILFDRHCNLRLNRMREIGLHLAIPLIILLLFAAQKVKTPDDIQAMSASQQNVWKTIEQQKEADQKTESKTTDQKTESPAQPPQQQPGVPAQQQLPPQYAQQMQQLPPGFSAPPAVPKLTVDQNRMLLTPKIPHLIPLTLVLAAIFCGTFISCAEISQERQIYLREHQVSLEIPVYLLAKLPLLFGITFIQMSILIVGTVLLKDLKGVPVLQGVLVLTLASWTSITLGIFLSSLDKTGKSSVLMSIIVIIPQIIFSGAIAPDFYSGMNPVAKLFAAVFVSRWGFEGLARIFNDTNVIEWGPKLVEHQLGFVSPHTTLNSQLMPVYLVLTGLSVIFIFLTGINLKIQDKLK